MKNTTKQSLSMAMFASILLTSSISAVNVKAAPATAPEAQRLAGKDRYETASKVSQAGWATSDYAIIASGQGYPDALCAAPLAKANNAPILLTEKDTLTQSTLDELKRLQVKHVYIIGGEGVVSKSVEDKIKSDVTVDIQRLAGQTRYETSVKVAEKIGVTDKVILASGEGYADALSAAPVAAVEGMPVLLTAKSTITAAVDTYIKANPSITKTYVIGGVGSVSDAAAAKTPNAERLGGVDRYDTNSKVLEAFSSDFNYNNIYVALGNGPTGNEFADALSASAIAAKNGQPVVISSKTIDSKTQSFVKSKIAPSSSITMIGGTAVVPAKIADDMKLQGTLLNEDGKTYTNAITGSADITGKNVTLQGNVTGDLYISADNANLSNITVTGTVFVNPGVTGVSNLNSVTANNIVVLSGAKNSIHLKDTKAKNVKVQSRSDVRIQTEGTTAIDNTTILSKVILEATSGSFGNVNIAHTVADKTVELRGTFDKLITVDGQVNLKTALSAIIEGILVSDKSKENVDLTGEGTIKNIQVKNPIAILNISKGVSVIGKIEALNKNNIKSEDSSILSKVNESTSGNMTDIGSNTNSTEQWITVKLPTKSISVKVNGNLNSTVKDLYDANVYNNETNKNAILSNLDQLKAKVDNKGLMVGDKSIYEFVGMKLYEANQQNLAVNAATGNYDAAVKDLFSKNYDQASALLLSLTEKPMEVQQPSIDGKKVTSIVVKANKDSEAVKTYTYSDTQTVNTIDFAKIRAGLISSAIGNMKFADLKQKSIYVEFNLADGTKYTFSSANGNVTIASVAATK